MPNILFSYMYRDSANYKNHGEVVFANPNNMKISEISMEIEDKLMDGEWFHAHRWHLPDLHFEKWDSEIDHDFHEFKEVEETEELVTDRRTIDEFLNSIPHFMESPSAPNHPPEPRRQ